MPSQRVGSPLPTGSPVDGWGPGTSRYSMPNVLRWSDKICQPLGQEVKKSPAQDNPTGEESIDVCSIRIHQGASIMRMDKNRHEPHDSDQSYLVPLRKVGSRPRQDVCCSRLSPAAAKWHHCQSPNLVCAAVPTSYTQYHRKRGMHWSNAFQVSGMLHSAVAACLYTWVLSINAGGLSPRCRWIFSKLIRSTCRV